MDRKVIIWKYTVCGAVAVIAAMVTAIGRGIFQVSDAKTAFGILSDSLFVPGLVLGGGGALGFAASKGAYDAFGYTFSRFSLHSLFPTAQTYHRPESFYEYKRLREEKRRPWSPVMLFTGIAVLLLSIVCLGFYSVL